MTVNRLREEISAEEWMQWSIYYGRKAQQKQIAAAKARG